MFRSWVLRGLVAVLLLVVVLAVGAVAAGQAGLLQGQAPPDLGVHEGRLKAPSTTPNSVSSQARLWVGHPRAEAAHIDALPLKGGSGERTLAVLAELVRATPAAVVVTSAPDYLHARFSTPLMKYTDDVEFWFDRGQGVVQVRSASRLGESDLGLNRERVESLRAQLAARP